MRNYSAFEVVEADAHSDTGDDQAAVTLLNFAVAAAAAAALVTETSTNCDELAVAETVGALELLDVAVAALAETLPNWAFAVAAVLALEMTMSIAEAVLVETTVGVPEGSAAVAGDVASAFVAVAEAAVSDGATSLETRLMARQEGDGLPASSILEDQLLLVVGNSR